MKIAQYSLQLEAQKVRATRVPESRGGIASLAGFQSGKWTVRCRASVIPLGTQRGSWATMWKMTMVTIVLCSKHITHVTSRVKLSITPPREVLPFLFRRWENRDQGSDLTYILEVIQFTTELAFGHRWQASELLLITAALYRLSLL